MKSTIIASLVAAAAAFAPASHHKAGTSLAAKADFANEIGAQAPLGVFDPFNVLGRCDKAEFDRIRAVEIKHGRVAMLAVVGYLTTAGKFTWIGCHWFLAF
jgi:Chlorophyll A-B binding protein